MQNTGERAGEEIVQMYINTPVCDITRPVKTLKGFTKVALECGEKKTVTFSLTPELMTTLDTELKECVDKGIFTVFVGTSSKPEDLLTTRFKVS